MTSPPPTSSDRGTGAWTSRPPLSRAVFARLVQLAGTFNMLSAVVPTSHGRMAALLEFVPAAGILSARSATAAVGVLLVYLGAGLRRGKHRAWQLAVALAGAGVVLHLLKDWTWTRPQSPARCWRCWLPDASGSTPSRTLAAAGAR